MKVPLQWILDGLSYLAVFPDKGITSTVYVLNRPKKFFRLDAGTFGTMGVGCGFAIAAALVEKNTTRDKRTKVVSIQGDSAFGFSGMEFETACR